MLVNVLCRPDSVIQCVVCCLCMELAEFDCSDRPANLEVMIANIFSIIQINLIHHYTLVCAIYTFLHKYHQLQERR